MNLPLFLPGMQNFIVICIAIFAGAALAIYLLKYKFKHPFIRKVLTIFVLIVAGVVTAYILFYIISNAVGRAKVESKLASMHERKILLSEEDVFPQMLANTDNGANFYMAAFSLMDASISYATFDKMNIKHLSNIQEWTKDDQKIAQKLLATEDLNLIIDLLHQATEKPYAVYKRHYNGLSILLPESTSQRELFRFISTKSFCEGLAANKEAGYHLLLDGFKMIIQLKGEKILVLQLNNIACVSINIRSMNELISRYGISTSSALQLLAELEKINFNQAMINGFDGDIMMWRDDIFGKIINGETKQCIEQFKDVLPVNKRNIMRYLSLIWPFFYQDYACYLTQMDKIRNLFDKPYWNEQNEINELSREISNTPEYYLISNFVLPMLISFRIKTANIESEIDAAKMTLALHIYKNQTGAFPDKLEQLTPGILKEIPVDPISGKPFEYRKTDGSFTLSSVWLKGKQERPRTGFGIL